jgi:Rrf2 family iron-sulfur cluster assembly transcriptional regulator
MNQSCSPRFSALSGGFEMRLSTKGRFAVNAMIDIALREALGPVSLTDIASRQQISLSYLEQVFSKLRLKGLVASVRGPGGGYGLARRTDGITVADIIYAVEDASPKSKQSDATSAQDMTQELWDAINAKLLNFMQSVTLKSLVLDQVTLGFTIEKKPPLNRGVFKKPVQQSARSNVPNSVFALGQILLVP